MISKNTRIGVIAGGFSGEREVSLRSGKNVLRALHNKGYNAVLIDPAETAIATSGIAVAFLALHGQFGEDGCIQAYLSQRNIPYTGSGVQASILGMNKLMSKQIMDEHGLPTAAYLCVSTATYSGQHPELPFPVIIKPLAEGSSLGVTIVDRPDNYQEAIAPLLSKYGVCLVEEYISGRELTIGVLDHGDRREALPILELQPVNRFYDYDAKYTPGKTRFILPAPLPEDVTANLQAHAIRLHEVLGCAGASRTDMIFHPTRGAVLLEINTAPGMTDQSDLPAQAQAAGIDFDTLVELILQSATHKKTDK